MADEPALADQLDSPLGREPRPRRSLRIPSFVPQVVAGVLAAAVLGFFGWLAIVDDPLGGEPVAIVFTKAPPKPEPHAQAPAPAPATPAQPQGQPQQSGQQQQAGGGQPTVTVIDGSSGTRQEVPVAPAGAPAPGAAEKLLEKSRHGPIPRVGPDGARPADVYASRVPAPGGGPRVVLVIGRMGVSANTSAEALAKLPAAVTMAFTPYAADLERWASRARGEGREVLLQVPLEPFDYPNNDPGPQALLTSLSPDQNVDRLHWSMSRFQGYVGVANYMGARFGANEQAVSALMHEVGKRGLIYFDDGSTSRGLFGQVAGAANVPFVKADVVVDARQSAAEIDAALGRLEAIARERGTAVGSASAIPLSVDRIAQWAKGLAARGIALVPISAVAARPKSS